MENLPNAFQKRTLWTTITFVCIAILGALGVWGLILAGKIFSFLQPVLLPLLVAGVIAYLLDPIVTWLQKRKFSRLWSVITVLGVGLLIIVAMSLSILPAIDKTKQILAQIRSKSEQTAQVTPQKERDPNEKLSEQLNHFLEDAREKNQHNLIGWLLTEEELPKSSKTPAVPAPQTIAPAAPNAATPTAPVATPEALPPSLEKFDIAKTRAGRTLYAYRTTIIQKAQAWLLEGTNQILAILGLILGMILVPIYLFFFLKDADVIRNRWHEILPLRASHFKDELVDCIKEINGYMISFFRGQMLVAMIDGVLVGISLYFYNLPYAILLGLFMAILGIIPYVGNLLCLIPACLIAFLNARAAPELCFGLSPISYAAGVLIIFIVVQQINSMVTAPKIVGDSVGLHPMTVIFSMLFWTLILGGFAGAILAVPLTASLKVLLRRYFWEAEKRQPAPKLAKNR